MAISIHPFCTPLRSSVHYLYASFLSRKIVGLSVSIAHARSIKRMTLGMNILQTEADSYQIQSFFQPCMCFGYDHFIQTMQ